MAIYKYQKFKVGPLPEGYFRFYDEIKPKLTTGDKIIYLNGGIHNAVDLSKADLYTPYYNSPKQDDFIKNNAHARNTIINLAGLKVKITIKTSIPHSQLIKQNFDFPYWKKCNAEFIIDARYLEQDQANFFIGYLDNYTLQDTVLTNSQFASMHCFNIIPLSADKSLKGLDLRRVITIGSYGRIYTAEGSSDFTIASKQDGGFRSFAASDKTSTTLAGGGWYGGKHIRNLSDPSKNAETAGMDYILTETSDISVIPNNYMSDANIYKKIISGSVNEIPFESEDALDISMELEVLETDVETAPSKINTYENSTFKKDTLHIYKNNQFNECKVYYFKNGKFIKI